MPRTRISTVLLAASALAASPSCRGAAPAPAAGTPQVVQPGAPGSAGTVLPAGTRAPAAPSYSAADATFMQGMIHHHAQAIDMVELLKDRSQRADMKLLGQRIEISQNDEIKMMKTWLTDRGEALPMEHSDHAGMMMPMMPGMLTPEQMTALAKANGPEFDRLFLEGMIQHHGGALVMVNDLLKVPGAAQESTMFDFITHVDADQRMEIARMGHMLDAMRGKQ